MTDDSFRFIYKLIFAVMPDLIRHPVSLLAGVKILDSGFRRNDDSGRGLNFMD